MKEKVLYICAAVAYIAILVGFLIFFMGPHDETSVYLASSIVTGLLMLLTLIFGAIVLRGNDSERYRELYMNDEEEVSKKE